MFLIKYIKQIFIIEKKSQSFLYSCAISNRIPAKVIMTMIFIMQCFMILCYIIQKSFLINIPFHPQYIYMYIFMSIFSLCIIILLAKHKSGHKKLMNIQFAILLVMGIWSAIFSYFDVINGYTSYLFIQLMIINSLVYIINPVRHCIINLLSFTVYLILILFADLSLSGIFAEFINPLLMLVASCIIIFLNYRTKYKNYVNQKLIQEQNLKLNYYANHDFLTNILNRKSIVDNLIKSLSKNNNLSCMLIDIDDFKIYNDTYGHNAGDACLIRLSASIEDFVLKSGGKVGRYGGEEFLAIYENMDDETVIKCASDLVKLVEEEHIEFNINGVNRTLTVSIGLYIKNNSDAIDKNKLLELADIELYKAKKEGKNRISVSSTYEESVNMDFFI